MDTQALFTRISAEIKRAKDAGYSTAVIDIGDLQDLYDLAKQTTTPLKVEGKPLPKKQRPKRED